MSATAVMKRMDEIVDDFCKRNRFQTEPLTPGRARTFVKQHRMNTRQRNSVLKLKVATNIPDWDTKLKVIKACSQEIIADNEFGHGKPHWEILTELGEAIGLKRDEILAAKPLPSTQIAWAAWEGLMANKHWLEGIVANACAERANVPGYGTGMAREIGMSGAQRPQWKKLFNLSDDQVEFWEMHSAADLEHSNIAWHAVAENAERLRMEDHVLHALDINLRVWEMYFHGICDAGDQPGA
jgi:pyrroloquinoline quinone (PQQ) biosynthesis protein C